jgi:hypothetical protein
MKTKIKVVILVWLIGDKSRYLCSKNVEQLPNEITHRRKAGAHPRSHRSLIVHYWMKTSLQTFSSARICCWSPWKMTFLELAIRDVHQDWQRVKPARNGQAAKNREGITSKIGFQKRFQTKNVGNRGKRGIQREMSVPSDWEILNEDWKSRRLILGKAFLMRKQPHIKYGRENIL